MRGAGHEVSILIRLGDGDHAGRGPSNVSTMIIRPPQHGQRRAPVAQQFEQLRREHHITIALPLALLDPESHALAVNVGHLQVRDFGHAQARAVGDAERRFVLEARRGFEEARHLFLAQHDRRPARLGHDSQGTNEVGPFERHGEEELMLANNWSTSRVCWAGAAG